MSSEIGNAIDATIEEFQASYAQTRRQTLFAMIATVTMLGVGLLLVVWSFTSTGSTKTMTAVLACVSDFITILAFGFYYKHFNALQLQIRKSEDFVRALIARKFLDDLPDEKKHEAMKEILDFILERTAILDARQTEALVILYNWCLSGEILAYLSEWLERYERCRDRSATKDSRNTALDDLRGGIIKIRNQYRSRFAGFRTCLGDLNEYLQKRFDRTGWWDDAVRQVSDILHNPQDPLCLGERRKRMAILVRKATETQIEQYQRDIQERARQPEAA